MRADHEFVRDNLDAWSIGALDRDESRLIDDHLDWCNECAAIARDARGSAAMLALAVPLTAASPSLRNRLLTSIGAPERRSRERAPARGWQSWWPAAAAAVLTVALGGLAWNAYLQSQVSDVRDRNDQLVFAATRDAGDFATMRAEVTEVAAKDSALTDAQDAIVEIVSQPDAAGAQLAPTAAAPFSRGRYMWSRNSGRGALVVSGLAELPQGQRYAMWIVYADAWVWGGMFDAGADGTGRLIVSDVDDGQPHGAFQGFAVTIEPAASQTHTGLTVLTTLN